MKLSEAQIKMMQEDMYADLIQLLMERRHATVDEAMDTFYNSETFARLKDTTSGWYYQSPGYVYSFLEKEIETGDYRG